MATELNPNGQETYTIKGDWLDLTRAMMTSEWWYIRFTYRGIEGDWAVFQSSTWLLQSVGREDHGVHEANNSDQQG